MRDYIDDKDQLSDEQQEYEDEEEEVQGQYAWRSNNIHHGNYAAGGTYNIALDRPIKKT